MCKWRPDNTYAPIAKYNIFQTITTLARHKGWFIFLLDVKTTFLNLCELVEEVFIEQPKGFKT